MSNKHYILAILAILLTGSCSEELINVVTPDGEAVELRGVEAEIVSGTGVTRANGVEYLKDSISRYQFVHNDKMVFTQIHRTSYPLVPFKYKDIAFDCNESGAWQRDKNTGVAGEGTDVVDHPERIYWSDASSPHTFIGYSKPRDNSSFDWKKSSYYYDKDGTQYNYDTYYGAIGDPTNASETINYNETSTETITQVVNKVTTTKEFKYSPVLRNEDLLLTYDDKLVADNSVANIKFHHALSSVRVIVNISGFYGTDKDGYSVVSEMTLLEQPTMYRWKQVSYKAEPLINSNENTTLHQSGMWGEGSNAPAYDQRKPMKLWNANPVGVGTGSSKTFTFFGITVPQEEEFFTVYKDKDLKLEFKVTYPDPMKNDPVNHTVSKWYSASIPVTDNKHVYFRPGQCTTIKVTLNHKDESMTIGASYMDWEYVETPDEGSLKKNSTFLQAAPELDKRASVKVTIATDPEATADDATWLYLDKKADNTQELLDIYGNDGTASRPFTISTANQLLSFAYEVTNGRTFAGQYVKLDADITMQKGYAIPTDDNGNVVTGELVNWIGIGNAHNSFNGTFLGSGRNINKLYGSSFFKILGDSAIVEHLSIIDAVQISGTGCIAETNNGIVSACHVQGDVVSNDETNQYCGSIVGINNGVLITCSHIGKTSGYGTVGVVVGKNDGIAAICYGAGDAKNLSSGQAYAGIGEFTNRSIAYCCYFNSDLYTGSDYGDLRADGKIGHVAFPLTTAEMQSNKFVNQPRVETTDPEGKTVVSGEITDPGDKTDEFYRHWSLNAGLAQAVQLLTSVKNSQTPDKNGYLWFHQGTFDHYNPMPLKVSQVDWLIENYKNNKHQFLFIPATYPKAQ